MCRKEETPVPGAVLGDCGSAPGFWKGTTSPWHMPKLEAQPSVQTGFRFELVGVSLAEVKKTIRIGLPTHFIDEGHCMTQQKQDGDQPGFGSLGRRTSCLQNSWQGAWESGHMASFPCTGHDVSQPPCCVYFFLLDDLGWTSTLSSVLYS